MDVKFSSHPLSALFALIQAGVYPDGSQKGRFDGQRSLIKCRLQGGEGIYEDRFPVTGMRFLPKRTGIRSAESPITFHVVNTIHFV